MKAAYYTMRVTAVNAISQQSREIGLFAEAPFNHVEVMLEASTQTGFPSLIKIRHDHPLPSGFVNVSFGDDTVDENYPLQFDDTGIFVLRHT